MKLIQGINENPNQTIVLTLEDGTRASLTLEYREQQLGWFYDLTYNNFTSRGNRLVTGPNILRQYRDLIPFGIMITTVDKQEPQLVTAFTYELAAMYLLDVQDVFDVEFILFPGT